MFAYAKVFRSNDIVHMIVKGGPNKTLPDDDDEFYHVSIPANLDARGAMKVVGGQVVECRKRDVVTANEIKAIRHSELTSSDFMFGEDSPVSGKVKEAWRAYRKALRGITDDGESVESMVSRFPVRPDGVDPVKDLR